MKPLRVLIVDDDRDFAAGLALLLRVEGYEVVLAASGEEALEIFKGEDFDITFMDVRLPGMSGMESFFEIRRLKPDARVMMMTAFSVEQLLRDAVDGGALGVLDKPLDPDKVLDILESVKPAGLVLVVDDDPEFAHSLQMYLAKAGYRVLLAHTGREAVDRVLANGVDVLVLDLRLPVMSGLEVYLELKRRQCSPPTMVVTGYAVEEAGAIHRLKQMSVAGCLVKPFAPEALISAIGRLMQNPDEKISAPS